MRKWLCVLVYIGVVLFVAGCEKKVEPTAAPSLEPVTASPKPTKTKEESKVVTDEVTIQGMAKDICDNMTLEEKIGQLFIVNLELLDSSKGSFYEHRKMTNSMELSIKRYNPGGVIFFTRNIETRDQTKAFIEEMNKISKYPLWVSVDEEGGSVSRIANNTNMGTTKFPTMEEIGKYEDKEYAYNLGTTIGKEIKELGFNLDFAPVADVKTNELNLEIGDRSFGSDPKLVATMVRQVVKGLQGQGVSATLKHFPGHGDASEDSHKGSVNIQNDLNRIRKVDFVPFVAGVKAGADFIMVSHISISRVTEDTVPASLSALVMKEIIRTELGFDGIVITDAMNMKAITTKYTSEEAALQTIESGADMVLMPEDFEKAYNAILTGVKEGTVSEERIDKSVHRIIETKIKRGLILEDTPLIYK